MLTTKQKREYAKAYYYKKKNEKLNGKVNGKATADLLSVVTAYQTLNSATIDGQIKADLTKSFASIVSKITH